MRCGRKAQGGVLQSLVTDEFVENDEVVLGAGSHGDCRGARKSKLQGDSLRGITWGWRQIMSSQ